MLDEAARNKEAVLELELVKVELAEECRRCVELEKMLEELGLNSSTPVVPARRMMSTDPLGSATDVESLDGYMLTCREPKAVQEVDEDEGPYSDQENQLLPPLWKIRVLSLGASSVQLKRILHFMLNQGSTSFSKRRTPRKSWTSVQKMSIGEEDKGGIRFTFKTPLLVSSCLDAPFPFSVTSHLPCAGLSTLSPCHSPCVYAQALAKDAKYSPFPSLQVPASQHTSPSISTMVLAPHTFRSELQSWPQRRLLFLNPL